MNRRQYLALGSLGVAGSLSGCVSSLALDSGTQGRTITLVELDESPPPYGFEVAVEKATLHGEEPAIVEVTMRNEYDEELSHTCGCVFDGLVPPRANVTRSLQFIPSFSDLDDLPPHVRSDNDEDPPLLRSADGCWLWNGIIGVFPVASLPPKLAPGESVSRAPYLAGNADKLDGTCPEPGTYRFEADYTYWEAVAIEDIPEQWGGPHPPDAESFHWGFDVHIE